LDLYKENEKKQKGIELFILIIYTFYSINMTLGMIRGNYDLGTIFIMYAGLLISWVLFIVGFRNYNVRTLITTISIQLSAFLYGISSDDFVSVLPTIFVLCTCVALFGRAALLGFSSLVMFLLMAEVIIEDYLVGNISSIPTVAFQLGNMLFFIAILHVWISQKNASVKELNEVVENMARTEQAKDDFLANVSHEIRTPLNTIYGMSDMIRQETDISKIKEENASIETASRNLMAMVRDILDFSELQAEDIELEEEIYDITSSINDVITMTKAAIGEKDIELIVDLQPDMPKKLLGDEKKLRRIVMNLVGNAIKFTQSGSIVIKITARKESYGANLCISVTDTGIGIHIEDVEKLFTSFTQVDTKRNRQESGLGLGLAISRLLAQKMGGVISVRSKEGKGSTFTLVVPQKIVDSTPVVVLNNPKKLFISTCVDMENFDVTELRDSYSTMIRSMINNFGIANHTSTSIEELKRRVEQNDYTHVFTTTVEYNREKEFFDRISEKCEVVVIYDEREKVEFQKNILYIQKPFYALSVATVLNRDPNKEDYVAIQTQKKFIAPDAKILVVDDNIMNIRVVEHLLKQYKIQVDRAISGMEALEKVESKDYDFIFMDHMMPEMDGVETFHRIREKSGDYFQNVPIIALTANAVAGSREMFIHEGFTDFVEKPVEISVLDRVLRRRIPEDKLIYEDENGLLPLDEVSTKNEKNTTHTDNNIYIKGNLMSDGLNKDFYVEGMDMDTGMLYCGGIEGFYMILAECVMSAKESAKELEDLLAAEDWQNYIIKIHALKSTMKSVGAMDLSEKARVLEFAGKAGEYDKIFAESANVVKEYRELMELASRQRGVKENLPDGFVFGEENSEVSAEALGGLDTLTASIIDELASKFEEAMYSLDQSVMEDVLQKLMNYQYDGQALKSEMEKLLRKVSQGDFFSAGDAITALKLKVKGGN